VLGLQFLEFVQGFAYFAISRTAYRLLRRQLGGQQTADGVFQAAISSERRTEKLAEEFPERNNLLVNRRWNDLPSLRLPGRARKRWARNLFAKIRRVSGNELLRG
jgi:hypothetical protein